jgi:hypothetical protein
MITLVLAWRAGSFSPAATPFTSPQPGVFGDTV